MQPNTRIRQHILLALAYLFLALVFSACGGAQEVDEPSVTETPDRQRYGTLSREGLDVTSVDINLDGRADQFTLTNESGVVVRVERDLDFDGRIELFEYFDAEGTLLEQEFQLDFDSSVDAVAFYEEGRLIRRELSTSFNGEPSLVKYYDRQEQLLRVERDSDGDGRVDVWEYHDSPVPRWGRDGDGDGEPDSIETLRQ